MAKQEVTTKAKQEVSTNVNEMFNEMDYGTVESKDLLVPKILLMQGSSEKVKDEGTHKAGDIIKSTDGTVYGSARAADAKPLKFIPLFMYKTWVTHEILGPNKKEYVETTPVTPMNTNRKWEEEVEVDGVRRQYRHTKNINFYVLLEQDFGNVLAVPHVLTYRSTSSKAAQLIEDWFFKCMTAQKARIEYDDNGQLMLPFAKIFELGGKLEKNDDNSWYVLTTKEAGKLDKESEVLGQAYSWFKLVSKYDHVQAVDNSDESQPAGKTAESVKF